MIVKDLIEHLQKLDPNDQIAVIYYTQDEFDGDNHEMIDSSIWNKAVQEFEQCDDVDSSVTAFITDQVNFLRTEK